MTEYPGSGSWPGGEQPPGRGGPDEPERDPAAEPVDPGGTPEPEDVQEAEVVDESTAATPPDAGEADDDVVVGEVVEPDLADSLLAEALDADAVEAEFGAAEADARTAAELQAATNAALTADLQRVHAEYSNYRKRVERDRALMRDRAVEDTLAEFLPVLDDISRARDHGDLTGGFKAVAEALEATVARKGLVPFGTPGEPFDPTRHEALMREERPGVTEPTVVTVLQLGYEMNGRIVRPARVSVAGTD